ncbi:Uncharacterised protein [uncultured archaeon]|nr:Uncharacterised protein [uncultured archaeon]
MVVGSYLIEDNILRDAVRSHDGLVDLSFAHQAAGHALADEGDGNSVPGQLPGREARALMKRPGLAGIDMDLLASRNGRTNHTQGCSPANAGQSPGVAVGENIISILQELGPVLSQGFVYADIFLCDLLCLTQSKISNILHSLLAGCGPKSSIYAPGEVDGRGP